MKKINFRYVVISAVLLLLISSCYYDNEEELYPGSGGLACDTTGVTFTVDIMPIVNTKCALSGCHASGGLGPPITNQSQFDALGSSGKIRNRVLVLKDMPPSNGGGPLPLCEQQKVDAYLKSKGW